MTFLRKKNKNADFWGAPNPVRIMVLIVGLLLATMILVFMMAMVSSLVGISASVSDLRVNVTELRHVTESKNGTLLPTSKESETTQAPANQPPVVLFSVTKYAAGEQPRLQANLVEPLLSYYAVMSVINPLTAVLVERKNVASHDVNVRLFFADGTENAYLWPSTHSTDGIWAAPCTKDPAKASADMPLCMTPVGNAPQPIVPQPPTAPPQIIR